MDKTNSNKEIYELSDKAGFRFAVFVDRFEITPLKKVLPTDSLESLTITKNEIVGIDKFKAKELSEPDYIAIFTEDEDGIHRNMFAISERDEIDKLYKALRQINSKGVIYLLRKMILQMLKGKSWL